MTGASPPPAATPLAPAGRGAAPAPRRWLLFVHQLDSKASNARVTTWRRLQQAGALPLKQAIYVLPDTAEAREDFEWLKTEVQSSGGDADVFAAAHVDAWADERLVEEFRRRGQDAYEALARDAGQVVKRAAATRRRPGTRAPALHRLLDIFRERLAAIERVDFFGSAGRDRVLGVLRQIEERASPARRSAAAPAARDADAGSASYRGRLWVTRPRPGVDRMSSAWLIRRFIDRQARFLFAVDRAAVPADAVAFDMFGGEFTHRGNRCTFETLCAVFGVTDPAVARMAAIVHDLDLKDGRFAPPQAPTVSAMIEGLQLAYQDDGALLEQGIVLFESLYRSFERAARSSGPRSMVKPKPRPRPAMNTRSRRK